MSKIVLVRNEIFSFFLLMMNRTLVFLLFCSNIYNTSFFLLIDTAKYSIFIPVVLTVNFIYIASMFL